MNPENTGRETEGTASKFFLARLIAFAGFLAMLYLMVTEREKVDPSVFGGVAVLFLAVAIFTHWKGTTLLRENRRVRENELPARHPLSLRIADDVSTDALAEDLKTMGVEAFGHKLSSLENLVTRRADSSDAQTVSVFKMISHFGAADNYSYGTSLHLLWTRPSRFWNEDRTWMEGQYVPRFKEILIVVACIALVVIGLLSMAPSDSLNEMKRTLLPTLAGVCVLLLAVVYGVTQFTQKRNAERLELLDVGQKQRVERLKSDLSRLPFTIRLMSIRQKQDSLSFLFLLGSLAATETPVTVELYDRLTSEEGLARELPSIDDAIKRFLAT